MIVNRPSKVSWKCGVVPLDYMGYVDSTIYLLSTADCMSQGRVPGHRQQRHRNCWLLTPSRGGTVFTTSRRYRKKRCSYRITKLDIKMSPAKWKHIYSWSRRLRSTTSSSAVADKPARRASSRKTAKILKQSRDHNHTPSGWYVILLLELIYSLHVYKIWRLQVQPFQWYDCRPKNF